MVNISRRVNCNVWGIYKMGRTILPRWEFWVLSWDLEEKHYYFFLSTSLKMVITWLFLYISFLQIMRKLTTDIEDVEATKIKRVGEPKHWGLKLGETQKTAVGGMQCYPIDQCCSLLFCYVLSPMETIRCICCLVAWPGHEFCHSNQQAAIKENES